jgi:hypothetical protein
MNRTWWNTKIMMSLWGLALFGAAAKAQTPVGCDGDGYRVISRRWDTVLGTGWELKQNCAHPEWPTRATVVRPSTIGAPLGIRLESAPTPLQFSPPLLVHAGETVTLWLQEEKVRIEMWGVAEQSARSGGRVVVRVSHQSDDAGLIVDHIAGIVRGPADVEMER